MHSILLGAALALVSFGSAQAQTIGGRYDVIGSNPNGSTYRGTARITATSENTCRIVWDTGGISEGICMRNNNAFTAAYSMKGKVGLVIYQLMGDGSMQGLWTIADSSGVGRETLVPVR